MIFTSVSNKQYINITRLLLHDDDQDDDVWGTASITSLVEVCKKLVYSLTPEDPCSPSSCLHKAEATSRIRYKQTGGDNITPVTSIKPTTSMCVRPGQNEAYVKPTGLASFSCLPWRFAPFYDDISLIPKMYICAVKIATKIPSKDATTLTISSTFPFFLSDEITRKNATWLDKM